MMRPSFPLVVATAALMSAGCSKLVGVELALQEPCGQKNRALNGLQSFRVVSSGSEAVKGVTAFRANEPAGVAVGLPETGGTMTVTIEGVTDDITAGPNPEQTSATPRSVGRTTPLLIDENSLDVKATVLVGNVDSFGGPVDSSGDCQQLDNGEPQNKGRHAHTATYIPEANKVLLFGGAVWNNGEEVLLKSAEVFDPVTGTFTRLPEPSQARAYHTATLLSGGRVLILGGFSLLNGQVAPLINGIVVDVRAVDPYVQTNVRLTTPRAHHTTTLLPDIGMIAIIGGCTGGAAQGCTPTSAGADSTNITPMIEIKTESDLAASSVPSQGNLAIARAMHQAVAFPSNQTGLIVVSGGLNSTGALRSIEFLQVQQGNLTNIFAKADALPTAVVRHQMLAFNNDQFVVTGGQATAQNGVLSDAVPGSNTVTICSKTDGQANCTAGANLLGARFGHNSARLIDGTLIVVGGSVAQGGPPAEALRLAAGEAPVWTPTQGALSEARERAQLTLLGGELGKGFINQLFYSGGHSTLQPYETSRDADIYFGK